jgi:ribosomal protein S17E
MTSEEAERELCTKLEEVFGENNYLAGYITRYVEEKITELKWQLQSEISEVRFNRHNDY